VAALRVEAGLPLDTRDVPDAEARNEIQKLRELVSFTLALGGIMQLSQKLDSMPEASEPHFLTALTRPSQSMATLLGGRPASLGLRGEPVRVIRVDFCHE
jgi:hypothetical protein